jgi:hypothetical protein
MEKITKYVIALFYEHDCVVVPRLGGFLGNYRPAFHDLQNNILVPPRKEFLFNRHLLHNDGLLAHKISTEEGMSYQDAVMLLDTFVGEVLTSLKQNQPFTLPGIGVLYNDKDQVIRLKNESANFLLASFGLPVVKCLPVIQRQVEVEETKIIELSAQTEPVADVPVKVVAIQRNARAKWWVAAALLPIGFYSAWIPMKTSLFSGKGEFHFSELNPFAFVKNNPAYSTIPVPALAMDSLIIDILPESTEENSATDVSTENWVMEDASTETTELSAPSSGSVNGSFHLIGGCFSKPENADKFVADMISQGLEARIIDQNGGLYRVAVASFESQEMALEFSGTLKSKDISTWILKKQL